MPPQSVTELNGAVMLKDSLFPMVWLNNVAILIGFSTDAAPVASQIVMMTRLVASGKLTVIPEVLVVSHWITCQPDSGVGLRTGILEVSIVS